MATKNTVEINIVELETLKKIAVLYKKDNPDWQEKVFGKTPAKVEAAKEKLKNKDKE